MRSWYHNIMSRQAQSTSPQKKSRPRGAGVQISVRLQPIPLADLDDWRRKQLDCPTRPQALRLLAALGLRLMLSTPAPSPLPNQSPDR
jgi:hypothetical protein